MLKGDNNNILYVLFFLQQYEGNIGIERRGTAFLVSQDLMIVVHSFLFPFS